MTRRTAGMTLAFVAVLLAATGCSSSGTPTTPSGVTQLKSDLYEARTAVLKYLAAQTADTTTDPTAATLEKYGFSPSKYTKDFKYFSNSAGVRFCIQATTPKGATYKIYLENNSKFSNAVSGTCVAGTDY